MALCVIISAHRSPQHPTTLPIINTIFQCGVRLLERCGSTGGGRVFVSVQDIDGKWHRKPWTDWNTPNGRQSVMEWIKRIERECTLRIEANPKSELKSDSNSTATASLTMNASDSLLDEVTRCISECGMDRLRHRYQSQAQSRCIYEITIIAEAETLNLDSNPDLNLQSMEWQRSKLRMRSDLVSRCRSDGVRLNLIALSAPSKNKKNSDSKSMTFWKSLVSGVCGVFQSMEMKNGVDPQRESESMINSMTQRIGDRHNGNGDGHRIMISIGSLMAECRIFDGLNTNHFVSPSNGSFHSTTMSTEWQRARRRDLTEIDVEHSNELDGEQKDRSPEMGVLSVLGFLDRDNNEWLPLPVLQRHFVSPHVVSSGTGEHVALFLRDLMVKWKKIAVVQIAFKSGRTPSNSKWFGVLHADTLNDGRSSSRCLLLDVLSPYINAPRLFQIESAKRPTPQYTVPDTVTMPMSNTTSPMTDGAATPKTMLAVYDSVSCYFPTESTVAKDFEKLVRILKQKKTTIMGQCFAVAESIRRRSRIFGIPHLLHHLNSVICNETKQLIDAINGDVSADPKAEAEKQLFLKQIRALRQMVGRSLTDNRIVIAMEPKTNDADGAAAASKFGENKNTKSTAYRSPSDKRKRNKGRGRGRGRGSARGRGKRRGHHHHRKK